MRQKQGDYLELVEAVPQTFCVNCIYRTLVEVDVVVVV